ncbi:MAG: AmmeMemoRadiSam system protein A [Patescibacteria group bacterium]
MYSAEQRAYLLQLARQAITEYLKTGESPRMETKDEILKEERATFVTLTRGGNLRGCIGSLEAHRPLTEDVAGNAVNAAVGDPRFPAASLTELSEIKIKISVLTPPRVLDHSDGKDLLAKLRPGRDGVILSDGFHTATYLPQVWEEIKQKKEFLESLCAKAGLPFDAWKSGKLDIQTYEVEKFGE